MATPSTPERAKFTSPFAPLELSHDEVETLEHLSRVILRNYMAQFEAFERESGGVVNERAWKQVKQREGIRAFVERRKDSDTLTNDLRLSVQSVAGSGAILPPDLPVVLVVGSIPGKLDDLMYGLLGNTTEQVRIRTAYSEDFMMDTAMLATLATPTQEDPYLSLTLRWERHRTGQGVLRVVVSDRDCVFMERTGLALTSSGERLGFHMLHSVHFPRTPELPGVIRANTSLCGIYRNNAPQNQVDVFVRGIADAGGSMIHYAVAVSTANTYTSIRKYVEASYKKKLVWRLHQNRKAAMSVTSSTAASSITDDSSETGARNCAVCGKTPSMAKSLVPGGRLRSCALCRKLVCSSCRFKKTLAQVTSASGRLEQRKFAFCCACFGDVCRMDALAIARAEAAGAREPIESFNMWSDSLSSISSE